MSDLTLDPKTTAVVWIDLQHGILQRQLAPHTAKEVVEAANQLTDAARSAGVGIVYVHVSLGESPDVPIDAAMPRPQQPVPAELMELVPELHRTPEDHVLLKRQRGAFYGTDLDQVLRMRGIRTIVLGGVATNIGVESTAREAFDRRYAVVFAHDAMTSVSEELHRFAVEKIFPMFGRVRSTAEIVRALQG